MSVNHKIKKVWPYVEENQHSTHQIISDRNQIFKIIISSSCNMTDRDERIFDLVFGIRHNSALICYATPFGIRQGACCRIGWSVDIIGKLDIK